MTPAPQSITADAPGPDWLSGLPVLSGGGITLREVEPRDAVPLAWVLGTDEVMGLIPEGPRTAERFGRFVGWARDQRAQGRYLTFAVIAPGTDAACGLFQVWPIDPDFGTAEWGFALSPARWGTGLFHHAAALVLEFVFDTLGVERLEARACVDNHRGAGALLKLGARPEGILRKCFEVGGARRDHVMWSLLREDWCKRDRERRDREPAAACGRLALVRPTAG